MTKKISQNLAQKSDIYFVRITAVMATVTSIIYLVTVGI